MSGPYGVEDVFETASSPLVCNDPENCIEDHNEENPSTGESHHVDCECSWCNFVAWSMG